MCSNMLDAIHKYLVCKQLKSSQTIWSTNIKIENFFGYLSIRVPRIKEKPVKLRKQNLVPHIKI